MVKNKLPHLFLSSFVQRLQSLDSIEPLSQQYEPEMIVPEKDSEQTLYSSLFY